MRLLKRERASEILFHHRFPTSTANVRNACHPFSTKNHWDNNYVMVHNGVIWNDFQVAKKQTADGIRYASFQANGDFNDSEVLMYDIAQYLEGEKDSLECEGNIAFIMVQRNKKGEKTALFFGRNTGNPLKIQRDATGFSLTSEGAGENIKPNTLFRFDYNTGEITESPLEIPMYTYVAPKGNYGNYMGYNSGYDWDGKYDDERSEADKEIAEYNQGFVKPGESMTENALVRYADIGRYGLTEETLEATEGQIVSEVVEALRYDTYMTNDTDALEFGEMILDEMQSKYLILENIVAQDGDLDGNELDEYMALDNQIQYLTKAMNFLSSQQLKLAIATGMRSIGAGQAQNVRYTPDH